MDFSNNFIIDGRIAIGRVSSRQGISPFLFLFNSIIFALAQNSGIEQFLIQFKNQFEIFNLRAGNLCALSIHSAGIESIPAALLRLDSDIAVSKLKL